MDTRTYPRDHQHGDALSSALAEVARLRAELARQQDMTTHAIQAATTARANATELGKALDMALAERDEAYREVNAQTLKANSFRSELHRCIAHANELKEMLDTSVAERDALRAELADVQTAYHLCDAMREDAEREHAKVARIAEGLAQDLATERANMRTAEATIDAMRQAHSVIAARMEAMGWWC